MEESRRQAYLQAMGIDCFVPVPSVSPARTATVPAPQPASRPARQARVAQSAPIPEVQQSPPVKQPAVAVNPHPAEAKFDETAAQELRFTLQFFRIGPRLAVINELPYLSGMVPGKEEMELLNRMLIALGKPAEQALAAPELVFRWPLSDGESAAGSRRNEAQQLLLGMLQGRFAQSAFDFLLILSPRCEELLCPAGLAADTQPVSLAVPRCKAVFTHSLGAILSVPALKRPVWQALQPLVGILSGTK